MMISLKSFPFNGPYNTLVLRYSQLSSVSPLSDPLVSLSTLSLSLERARERERRVVGTGTRYTYLMNFSLQTDSKAETWQDAWAYYASSSCQVSGVLELKRLSAAQKSEQNSYSLFFWPL